ncbi:MAG TPA: hypothetical protein VGB76_09725 [Pyrinomonadaceae bacterium]|jgi:hypothetical protein
MTNEEMQRIMEFTMQRQEAFTEQQEKLSASPDRLEQERVAETVRKGL